MEQEESCRRQEKKQNVDHSQASVSSFHSSVDTSGLSCTDLYKGNLPTQGLPTGKFIDEVMLHNHDLRRGIILVINNLLYISGQRHVNIRSGGISQTAEFVERPSA